MSYQAQTWVDEVGIKHCKNGGELLVLIRVANHTNGDMRGCYASAETLAGECLMGESTVLKHLRRLKAGGVLLLQEVPDREHKLLYFVAIDDARFRRPVVPGDQLRLEVTVLSYRNSFCKLQGLATVNGEAAAEATLMCKMVDRE